MEKCLSLQPEFLARFIIPTIRSGFINKKLLINLPEPIF